jgi:hypothetical protein
VTRLGENMGEFSPNGGFTTLGSCRKIREVSHIFLLLYCKVKFLHKFCQKWVGLHFGCLTNSSGVDVMITIFGKFRQFSAKNLAFFFSKTNVMIKFLHNIPLF